MTTTLAPGQFATDVQGRGKGRVEIIAVLGNGMVEILPRAATGTQIVPASRLAPSKPSHYRAAGC